MSDDKPPMPYRPPVRGSQHYKILRQEITRRQPSEPQINEPQNQKDLFSMTITAANAKGEKMDERKFLMDVIFKPSESGLRLNPAQSQILLAYIGEILKEIEEEERLIIEEQKASENKEVTP